MLITTKKPILLALLIVLGSIAGCIGNDEDETELETLTIAFEVKDDYTNVDENPQKFADYLAEELNMNVELYPIDSEGAILESLRFGNADIAFMDGAAAWVGWQQYGLDALAADQKSDGRTYYNAHAVVLKDSEMAVAHLDGDDSTDPFALLAGKTSCHTGWLKSAGMLLPMGYLISEGYAPVVGSEDDIESLRSTIFSYFNEDASIPDSGTPYASYSGAVRCLSEGAGDVAFVKDSTIGSYCGNEDAAENEDWCLDEEEYILLPSYGSAPSHPVMYNPERVDIQTRTAILNALLSMNDEMYVENHSMGGETYTGCLNVNTQVVDTEQPMNECGDRILMNILNTPGIVEVNTQEHLGIYGNLIGSIPGITTYFDTKYEIQE